MRTRRLITALAAASLAVGLCACEEQATAGEDATASQSRGAEESPDEGSKESPDEGSKETPGKDTSASPKETSGAAEAKAIEPVVFTDTELGLTQTCDQIIEDFDAPVYKAEYDTDRTLYLLHCSFEFTGDVGVDVRTINNVTLRNDDNPVGDGNAVFSTDLEEDYRAAGLDGISFDEYGKASTTAWVAIQVLELDGKAMPLPEGATTVSYDRQALQNTDTGEIYEAHTDTAKLVIK
ncbi:hypothetical protein ACSL103130_01740 [Actinomyces slackii]|uniref:Lipoprotein n=1 Tax=Actinomyces slackii TaxID=52774 RepID=A0A448KAN3_9ACTO|nr:hypothetical protein [Actinomyces slackii]VEG73987.1 Uncharacterised protein [Actinomyces slackii]